MRRVLLLTLTLAVLAGPGTQAVATPVFEDHFDGDTPSPFWGTFRSAGTTLVRDTMAGVLRLEMDATFAGPFSGYVSNCTVSGDFDVQVDYSIDPLAPPEGEGIFGFSPSFLPFGGVTRRSTPDVEYMQFSQFTPSGYVERRTPATETSGSLHLVRTAMAAFASYSDATTLPGEVTIDPLGIPYRGDPVLLLIGMSGAHRIARATLDDFILNTGTLTCPFNILCGDGVTQGGEECDDGDSDPTSNNCCACRDTLSLPGPPDVAGGWQINVTCGVGPTAVVQSRPVHIDQAPLSGAITVTPTACAAVTVDGVTHTPATCDAGSYSGQVCGDVFAYGPSIEEATFTTPFGLASMPDCPNVDHMRGRPLLNGTITVDAGRAIGIAGSYVLRHAYYNAGEPDPCGEVSNATACTFAMVRNAATPENPTITPLPGVSLTFNFGQTSGEIEASVSQTDVPVASSPINFQVLGIPFPYFSIHQIAGPTPASVEICLPYTDDNHDGKVDQTGVDAAELKIGHENGAGGYDVLTTTVHKYPDDVLAPSICATVTSFSQFALLEPTRCKLQPATGCRMPPTGKGAFKAKQKPTDPTKGKFTWKWTKGPAQALEDFGDPLNRQGYHLCVYQNGQLVSSTAMRAGGTCAGVPCWALKPTGYLYKNRELTPDGAQQLVLKAGADGKAVVKFKGMGANLEPLPTGPLQGTIMVQLQQDDPGTCWTTTFNTLTKNTATDFSAKSD